MSIDYIEHNCFYLQTVIVTQNMTSSRLPQFVKDPLKFCPQRWQRDSEMFGNLHPFLSLPFGFGPRSCIARRIAEQNMSIMLLRVSIAYWFYNYEWKYIDGIICRVFLVDLLTFLTKSNLLSNGFRTNLLWNIYIM